MVKLLINVIGNRGMDERILITTKRTVNVHLFTEGKRRGEDRSWCSGVCTCKHLGGDGKRLLIPIFYPSQKRRRENKSEFAFNKRSSS
jgi:hypothetical protein